MRAEFKRSAGQRVIVTTAAAVIEGRVSRAGWGAVALIEAREVSEPGSPVVIVGTVVIPFGQISYVQVP